MRSSTGRNGKNAAKKTSWTIMLYIAADDTLANFAVESLKQLNKSASAPAGPTDAASVVVAAHFAFPADPSISGAANGRGPNNTVHQYIFKADSSGSHDPTKVRTLPDPVIISAKATSSAKPSEAKNSDKVTISEKEALKDFLSEVYKDPQYNAEHYALILWGHGPELLLQPGASNSTDSSNSMYITPEELREVLTDKKPRNGAHLEIIGFDACCMSMLEMACELKGLADFMVASQEDVPDLSFPYDNLIALFRKCGNKALPLLLNKGVEAYISTYQDCICDNNTGMKGVTLSVLDLRNSDTLKGAVSELAGALLDAKEDESLPGVLIEARNTSQDYAGGLYVDLYDFCTKLSEQLEKLNGLGPIKVACEKVLAELRKRSPEETGNTKGDKTPAPVILKNSGDTKGDRSLASVILANSGDIEDNRPSDTVLANLHDTEDDGSSNRKRSHGISIYLPYLTDGQYATVSKPLVKGGSGTSGAKGYTEVLNGAAVEYLMCARRELILVTESYYQGLQLAETRWYDFIAELWTKALIKKVPADLDYHYSAQQSWVNVCRKTIFDSKPETSTEPLTEMCSMK